MDKHEMHYNDICRKLEFNQELDFEDWDYIAGNGKIVEDNIIMFADRFFRFLDDKAEEVYHIIKSNVKAEWVVAA